MNKPVRVILLGAAKEEFESLNSLVGQYLQEGKESTDEEQLLKSIKRSRTDFCNFRVVQP